MEYNIRAEIKSLDEILDVEGHQKQKTPYASEKPLLQFFEV